MPHRGMQDGIRIYDYLDEVPDSIIESNQQFYLLYPPGEFIREKGGTIIKGNSFGIFHFIGLCIFIALVGTVTIHILQHTAYLFQGRPGNLIDPNLFEGGDGSVWVRDPETGEWTQEKGGSLSPIVMIVVAIGLIFIAILIFYAYTKSKEGSKTPSKKSKKSKKAAEA